MQLLNSEEFLVPNRDWLEQKLADADMYDLCLEFEPQWVASLSRWRDALLDLASSTNNDFIRNRAYKVVPVIRDILKSYFEAKSRGPRRIVRAPNVVHNNVTRFTYMREWYLIRF